MPIIQVSVFLDNRPGSLSKAMNQLDKNHIEIFALSIADAGEFGLIRMITENPEKTTKILEENDFNLAKSFAIIFFHLFLSASVSSFS